MSLDVHDHLHAHGDYLHRHPHGHGPGAHGHADEHTPLARLDRSGLGRIALYHWLRPFVVGLVHGLAGSAAVALMILSIIREPVAALGYLLLFGLGTIVGMMLITLILSAPFAFTAVNLPKFNWRLRVASGLVSFCLRGGPDLRHRICRGRPVHRRADLGTSLTRRAALG